MVGAVDNFPQSPRMLDPFVHSLNNTATNSVGCTLPLERIRVAIPSEDIRIRDDGGEK